jgi:hypothetical protein
MVKSFICSVIMLSMLALWSVQIGAYPTYPEKILIKNETGEPITYAIQFRTNTMQAHIAFVWLEPGEEQNITEKYYLNPPVNYLHIAINLKEPSKMRPFSSTESKKVDLGKYKEIRIIVYKRVYGPSHYAYRPVVTELETAYDTQKYNRCYSTKKAKNTKK